MYTARSFRNVSRSEGSMAFLGVGAVVAVKGSAEAGLSPSRMGRNSAGPRGRLNQR